MRALIAVLLLLAMIGPSLAVEIVVTDGDTFQLDRTIYRLDGIDAPEIHGSSNQVVPVARARVSLRLAPGDDAVAATHALISFLRDAAPWGVEVSIEGGSFDAGQGYMVDTSAPPLLAAREALREAYGSDVLETGSGGSIPLVPMLAETFPGIAVLMWGAMDERSNIHSVNESVDLGELEHMALAEALFMRKLAGDA